MLVRFNVGNFLSFREMQSFSMVSGQLKNSSNRVHHFENIDLLKSSYIYGPNSSGKSNLILAMYYSRNKILDLPMGYMRTDYKLSNAPAHRLVDGSEVEEPSYLEYILELGGEMYSYGFEIDIRFNVLISEWLVKLDGNTEYPIFSLEYEDDKLVTSSPDSEISELLSQYSDTAKKITFLKFLHINHCSDSCIKKVYQWFDKNLIIRTPNHSIQVMAFDEIKMTKLETILSKLDLNIKKLEKMNPFDRDKSCIHVLPYDSDDVLKEICAVSKNNSVSVLYFKHNDLYYHDSDGCTYEILISHDTNPSFLTSLSKESDGTIRIIKLLIDFISDYELLPTSDVFDPPHTRTMIIDEVECGIHVRMLNELLNLSFEICSMPLQWVVTTHETELLSNKKTHADEVWFMDMGYDSKDRKSKLYSLLEYKDVDYNNIMNDYFDGIYGAIPLLDYD